MSEMMVDCIVVHHRNVDGAVRTVRSVIREGVDPTHVMVIDNSEDASLLSSLRGSLPFGVGVLAVSNCGYAAAVNSGLDVLRHREMVPDAVLVLTHDVLLGSGTISRLVQDLVDDPRIGVVGPILIAQGAMWSCGGGISRVLKIPFHFRSTQTAEVHEVHWIDGAVNLYRWVAVQAYGLCEDYFMYFEEVDFHVELARRGWQVMVDPRASAEQESAGIPPRLHGRNLVLFVGRNFSPMLGVLSALLAMPRAGIWSFRHRAGTPFVAPYVRGVISGLRLLVRDEC